VTISTHVLDNARGEPASGVPVRLERNHGGEWVAVAAGTTDGDGRLRAWAPDEPASTGRYRLVFDLAAYLGPDAFFPEVVVVFQVTEPERHLHVPVLISPYGYTTYRGS
jgi:5-hydroxyisourate hydrolase